MVVHMSNIHLLSSTGKGIRRVRTVVRKWLLSQDPYHTPGQAQGTIVFVTRRGKTQPSMRNILKELKDDIGIERASQDLTGWARRVVAK